MASTAHNFYKLLGVSQTATKAAIKEAYYAQAKKLHPDRVAASATESAKAADQQVFKEITEAYRVLSNDTERQKYDLLLQYGPTGAPRGSGPQDNPYYDPNGPFWQAHMRNMQQRQEFYNERAAEMGWGSHSDYTKAHPFFDAQDYREYHYEQFYNRYQSPHEFYRKRYAQRAGVEYGEDIDWKGQYRRNRSLIIRFAQILGAMAVMYVLLLKVFSYQWENERTQDELRMYNQYYAASHYPMTKRRFEIEMEKKKREAEHQRRLAQISTKGREGDATAAAVSAAELGKVSTTTAPQQQQSPIK